MITQTKKPILWSLVFLLTGCAYNSGYHSSYPSGGGYYPNYGYNNGQNYGYSYGNYPHRDDHYSRPSASPEYLGNSHPHGGQHSNNYNHPQPYAAPNYGYQGGNPYPQNHSSGSWPSQHHDHDNRSNWNGWNGQNGVTQPITKPHNPSHSAPLAAHPTPPNNSDLAHPLNHPSNVGIEPSHHGHQPPNVSIVNYHHDSGHLPPTPQNEQPDQIRVNTHDLHVIHPQHQDNWQGQSEPPQLMPPVRAHHENVHLPAADISVQPSHDPIHSGQAHPHHEGKHGHPF